MNGTDPLQVLSANLASTRFASLRVEVTLTSRLPGGAQVTAKSRTLSRFETTPDGWECDVMSRVIEGQPLDGRFLIEQSSGAPQQPRTWIRDGGRARRSAFVPWQPFPASALRWMDHIVPPPGTFTASFNAAASPSDPGWAPPASCWVVDLALAPTFWNPEPRLMRLWIEQTAGRAVDHRVEQHLSDGSVRVIVSTNWAQLAPGSPWGPGSRLIDDPQLGIRTAIQVTGADPNPLDPNVFDPIVMADQDW